MSNRTNPLLRVAEEPSSGVLTSDEWTATLADLESDESVIERGLATFVEVGEALLRIRDSRSYLLTGYDTFEDYCRERWGFSRVRAHQLIESAAAVGAVLTIVNTPIANEGQAREVAAIIKTDGPERAAEVLDQVAANGKVTAAAIREAARPTKTVTVVEEITVDAETGEIVPPIESHPFIANDSGYQTAVMRHAIAKHLTRVAPLLGITTAEIADVLIGDPELIDMVRRARAGIDEWVDDIEAELNNRGRLRLIGGHN